ncbi:MAG: peroxiredoxin-like family protein [Polyangiaceae bacterium]
MSRLQPGATIAPVDWPTLHGARSSIPHPKLLTHLQFRRFAGCPVCNLHLRSFARNHQRLESLGIQEVVVFHSSREEMLKYHAELPFAALADPEFELYRRFGVERSMRAMLHPKALWGAMAGTFSTPSGTPSGTTALGLPADFLIAPSGEIVACHYGRHANDQWSVEDVLQLAR